MQVAVCFLFVCLLGVAQSASAPCPNGEELVDCNDDVCTGYSCLYPSDPSNLTCKINYCGECTRQWYLGEVPDECLVEDFNIIDE